MHELFTVGVTGLTLDAYIYNEDAEIYNAETHVFEWPVLLSWEDYGIALTENVGEYTSDFPTAIEDAGTYPYVVRTRAGGSPADTDEVYASGKVEWSGSGEASETPSSSECETFVTLAFVKSINEITDSSSDTQLNNLIPGVCEGIRKYLKRGVCATTRRETRSGRGTNYIRLRNPPVNTITNITFFKDEDTETTVSGNAFKWEIETGLVTFKPTSSPQYRFDTGFQNIEVIYNGGWVEIPEPIKIAAAMICKQILFLSDPEALVTEKVVGQIKVKYSDVFAGRLDDPLFAQAVSLLKPYRRAAY